MNVDAAKSQVLHVLAGRSNSEDHSGLMGFDPRAFERLVQLVEDQDPFWLHRHVRDRKFAMGVRLEVAGMMRGSQANRLLLEILEG